MSVSIQVVHLVPQMLLEHAYYDRPVHEKALTAQMHPFAILVATNVVNNIQEIGQIN